MNKSNLKVLSLCILAAGLVSAPIWAENAPALAPKAVEGVAPAPAENKVVAEVNGVKLTEMDIETLVDKLSPQLQGRFATPEGKKEIIDHMINELLMEQAALKKGLDKDPKVAALLNSARRQILVENLTANEIVKTEVKDEQAKKWYSDNIADLMQPEKVRASHILLKDEETAKKVLAKAKVKGADFAKLAQQYSEDPSVKENNGDLGFFTKDRMVAEFSKAAFALAPGEISDVVATQYGFHIIKLEEKQPAGAIPFDDIKPQIVNKLRFDNFIKPLRDAAKIQIVEEKPAVVAPVEKPVAPAVEVKPAEPAKK